MANEDKKKPTTSTKPKMIEVSEEGLKEMMKQFGDLQEKVTRLESAGDLGRLERYDTKNRKLGPRQYRLTVYNGKIVTGWRTLKDQKWMEGNVMRVLQEYEVIFEDLSKMEVKSYENFANVIHSLRVLAEKVSEVEDEHGKTLTLKIVGFPDPNNEPTGPDADEARKVFGKEVVIDQTFVN